jgi:signal peptidase II
MGEGSQRDDSIQSTSKENPVNPKPNALPWLLLSATIIVLDQWTKYIVLTTLVLHRQVEVIAGFWNWMLAYNEGAAFSFLGDATGWQRWLFAGLAIAVSVGMSIWLARTPRSDWRTALPFALVIGGALGNLIDRIRLGHVIDFIQWYWHDHYWPTFNVADSSIVAGAIALLLFGLRNKPHAAVS